MGRLKRFSSEAGFDLALVVLGLVVMGISLHYGFGTFSRPGSGLYPFFLGLAVFIFALFLFLSQLKPAERAPLFGRGDLRILLTMIATFCLWIVIMPLLGYVAMTLLVTFGFCKIMKLEGWVKPLAVSAGTAVFIYLLFDYWMYIDLPRGILG